MIQAPAAAIDNQAEWKTACMKQRGRMRTAGRWGYSGLRGGRLPTLCAPNPGKSVGHCSSLLVGHPES